MTVKKHCNSDKQLNLNFKCFPNKNAQVFQNQYCIARNSKNIGEINVNSI